jgi:hypothetical protein
MLDNFVVGHQYKATDDAHDALSSACVTLKHGGTVTCHSIDADGDMWTFDATFLGGDGPPSRGVCVGSVGWWMEVPIDD